MKYTTLGKSTLKVSRICMGCMGLGDPSKGMNKWAVPEEASREIIRYALDQGIALTPYSPLASGRLSRPVGETTKRLELDDYTKFKYDKSQDVDAEIIRRMQELAEKKNVSMTEISLSWILNKVTAPVMGVTKKSNIDGAVKAVELELTQDEMEYLEELYVPHALAGVMAQNGKQKVGDVV